MKDKGIVSEKEKLSFLVMKIAKKCNSLSELNEQLEMQSLRPYHRNGTLTGLWLGNRKYRLTTLGIGKEHLKELTLEQERLNELPSREKGRDRGLELER